MPICRELQVAPSTYYAAKIRPPSKRASMTLDVYSGLFDADLDDVALRMNEAASAALGGWAYRDVVVRERADEGATE